MHRRTLSAALTALLTAAVLSPAGGADADARSAPAAAAAAAAPDVVHRWQSISFETVYGPPPLPSPPNPPTAPRTPIPLGVPLLGYTSVAMHDAVVRAQRRGNASATAAVVVAAHDVLSHFFTSDPLAAERDADLAGIPAGTAKNRGMDAGADAADALLARVEDPRLNPSGITYSRAPAPGVWQPAPGGAMLGPWLGFMDELVVHRPIRVDGPDPITSAAYAFDYQEVKRVGVAGDTIHRTPHQTDTARFFNSNSAVMLGEALLAHLEADPLGLRRTTRLFAVMHGAMTDAVITCWRLKYDGFWRPFQAIQKGDTDGNPATVKDADWEPLIPNPPYADYVSGHACLTAPAAETIRRLLGEETELELHSYAGGLVTADRTYSTLSEIEYDAFHARIWGGLHFRDAMEDGYRIGHVAARRALRAIR